MCSEAGSLRAGALDIAVIQISRPTADLQPVPLSTILQRPGGDCFVVGHALFNPAGGSRPLLTCGNVAQVLALPEQLSAMLLTTAAVHSGASGGAVVDGAGRLLGLITSNARHASGEMIDWGPEARYMVRPL